MELTRQERGKVWALITKAQFESMTPYGRGYTVYMFGRDDNEPNIPDESNPYPPGSKESLGWIRGMTAAVLEAQDSEE